MMIVAEGRSQVRDSSRNTDDWVVASLLFPFPYPFLTLHHHMGDVARVQMGDKWTTGRGQE